MCSLSESGVLENDLGKQGDPSVKASLGPTDADGVWKVGGNRLLFLSCTCQNPAPGRLRNRRHCHAFRGDAD